MTRKIFVVVSILAALGSINSWGQECFKMDSLNKIIIDRLEKNGLENNSTPAYIRNLINTLDNSDSSLNLHELNRKMQMLGWHDLELDDHTLQLIMVAGKRQSLINI